MTLAETIAACRAVGIAWALPEHEQECACDINDDYVCEEHEAAGTTRWEQEAIAESIAAGDD